MATQKTQNTDFFKPFIKRVGGKRQLLAQFQNLYPKKFNNYLEPFIGGGAVFFDLRNNFGSDFQARLGDINEEMIITYNTIQNDVEGLIKELKTYKYDKDFFMEIRSRDRDPNFKKLSNVKRSARFIYLNRTGFNGLYRINGSGFYNVPFGKYTNPTICDEETLLNCQKALKNTIVENQDFSKVLEYASEGDFVYFDPPYDTLTETANFTGYNKGGFGKDEQKRLFEVYEKLDKKGCFVMLSNHNTDFINELFKKFIKKINLILNNIFSQITSFFSYSTLSFNFQYQ